MAEAALEHHSTWPWVGEEEAFHVVFPVDGRRTVNGRLMSYSGPPRDYPKGSRESIAPVDEKVLCSCPPTPDCCGALRYNICTDTAGDTGV